MIAEHIFEQYLEYKLQRAGALTPGQKLEVVQQLLVEARQGVVPAGETSVVRLPLNEPSVQAVIRGEPVSIGDTVVRRKSGPQNWSRPQQFAVMAALLLLPILAAGLYLLLGSKPKAVAPVAIPTLTPSETPNPTATPTLLPTFTASPLPTDLPTLTPVPALLIGSGSPAEEANAPASLEVGGRLFVLQKGKVDEKSGVWEPQGPEWLAGTEVRRVIALPLAQVADISIQPGDQVTLRTRNGRVVLYPVTQVLRLTPNQIEAFISLSPSIIIPFFEAGDATNTERLVVIGELPAPPAATATPLVQRARTSQDVNLRAKPSLKGTVLAGLPEGTWVEVPYPLQTRTAEGWVWLYVHTSFGSGWLVRAFINFNP